MNLKHNNPIAAFKKGWDEFRILLYDIGRELHHIKTKRKYDWTHPKHKG